MSARRRLARGLLMAPLWGLVTVLLLGSVGVAVIQRTGAAQLLTVVSGSMQPTLPLGSLVVVLPRDADAVRVGDVDHLQSARRRHQDGDSPDRRRPGERRRAPGAHPRRRQPGADPWTLQFPTGRTWVMVADAPWLGRPWLWLAQPMHRRLVLGPAALLVTLMWLTTIWRREGPSRTAF